MAALAHVFLHVGLCSAVARASPQTTVAMRVEMTYASGGSEFDKVFKFARADDPQTVVEFDVPRGTYRLRLDVPKYGCSTSDYLDILEEHNRNVSETLNDRPLPTQTPGVLVDGSAPISFLYVKPSFVLFDKGLACNQPVTPPLPAHVNIEYDQGSYYVWLFPTLRSKRMRPWSWRYASRRRRDSRTISACRSPSLCKPRSGRIERAWTLRAI